MMNLDRLLVKAKRVDNGEWVEGYYVAKWIYKAEDRSQRLYHYINWLTPDVEQPGMFWNEYTEIDPSTLCQCTGLKDKNGVLIFEGDIFEFPYYGKRYKGHIMWYINMWCIRDEDEKVTAEFDYYHNMRDISEVLGNIHDDKRVMRAV